MDQRQYYSLVCILLTRASKLRKAQIARYHRYEGYACVCRNCGAVARTTKELICPKRKQAV